VISDATAVSANQQPAFHALGDRGLVVPLGDRIQDRVFERVQALSRALDEANITGVIEHVPAYTTVTVYYDLGSTQFEAVAREIERLLSIQGNNEPVVSRTIEIPVCYGNEYGIDLENVARHNGLSPEEVIAIHSAASYRVHMLGFAPGFPYLGGMSERIATPRRDSPRLRVPAGSVGIAGAQTGIYPLETPGGWQIIGRTPLALFRLNDDPPTLLAPGDTVQFRPITKEEFAALQETVA
jgi:inhibitor of KinA